MIRIFLILPRCWIIKWDYQKFSLKSLFRLWSFALFEFRTEQSSLVSIFYLLKREIVWKEISLFLIFIVSNFLFSIVFWRLRIILFSFSDLSICLIWVRLIFIALTVIPFSLVNLEEESSSGYLKYILFQESYSVLLCIFLYFYFNVLIFVLSFLKLAIAPLGNWIEPLIKEIKSGFSWIITLPKILPALLLFCFSRKILIFFVIFLSFFCISKLVVLKNFQSIMLYVGNFSILFSIVLRIYSLFCCLLWFFYYIIISFFLLRSQIRILSCSFSLFFWMRALPPSPIFFLKFYLLRLLGLLRNKIIILFFILSVFLFYLIWDLTRKNIIKGNFFIYEDMLSLFLIFIITFLLYLIF